MLLCDLDNQFLNASYCGDSVMVERLLEAGANIHVNDDLALRWASTAGYINIVEVLLRAGANVDVMNNRALYLASLNGHVGVIKLLLQAGADVSKMFWDSDVPEDLSSMSVDGVVERFVAMRVAKELQM